MKKRRQRRYKSNKRRRQSRVMLTTQDLSPQNRNWMRIVSSVLITVILIAALYFLLFSTYFLIQQPVVAGIDNEQRDEVEARVAESISGKNFGLLPRNHLLLISASDLETELQKMYPNLANVRVEKALPNLLKVVALEKEPVVVWQQGSLLYHVDREGYAIDTVTKESKNVDLPQVVNSVSSKVTEGSLAMSSDAIEKILIAREQLPLKIGVEARSFSMPTGFALEFTVVTNEGWSITFDRQRSIQSQLSGLQTMLQEEIGAKREFLDYVDLRVENVGYFK